MCSWERGGEKWLWIKTHEIPFGVGEFTTHFRAYLSGDWDVHCGYDLDFEKPMAKCGAKKGSVAAG